MIELIKFILSDFWIFLGFIIILGGILSFIYSIWNRFLRHFTILKHGYPEGTNADGEFPKEKEDDE